MGAVNYVLIYAMVKLQQIVLFHMNLLCKLL